MHCCKRLLSVLSLAVALAWAAVTAHAEGISTNRVEVRLTPGGYQLSAGYDVVLNSVVQQALSRGVPLYFVSEFSLTRSRWGWLDEAQQSVTRSIKGYFVDNPSSTHWSWLDKEIFSSEQTSRLSYNVLTGRYRISHGSLFQSFDSLDDALKVLSRQTSGMISSELMTKDAKYMAAARLRLDVTQLPRPLQVNALTDSDWTLDSDWYRWAINPGEIIEQSETPPE